MSWSAVDRRLTRLQRRQAQQAGIADYRDIPQFTISATCPPSTSVFMRGGLIWRTPVLVRSYGWYIPSYKLDLADPDITYTAFKPSADRAYWYRAFNIVPNCYYVPYLEPREDWPDTAPERSVYLRSVAAWKETTEEVENTILQNERSIGQNYGPATTSVVLRNNGNTTEYNQWMPIDPVNRGRSYLFMNVMTGWRTV